MVKQKILLLGDIEHAQDSWSSLSKSIDVLRPTSTNRDDFIAECKSGAFADATVIYRSPSSAFITGQIDETLLAALPSSIKFICQNALDYSDIDTTACTKRSISISNVPSFHYAPTADLTLLLLLSLLRQLPSALSSSPVPGSDPFDKILGIVGLGGVGRQVATRARAFGMKVVYWNPDKLDVEHEEGTDYVEFDKLLAECDVLSLHLSPDDSNRNLFSTAEFNKMKEGTYIINTSHPSLIDTPALLSALSQNIVSGVGIDADPSSSSSSLDDLKNHPNTIILPRIAALTVDTQLRMEEWTIGNVQKAIEEGCLRSIVPEQE